MPLTKFDLEDKLEYLKGLNAHHVTEVVKGIIPSESTYEQKGKFGVYPERLSGTSFTTPRAQNKQAFLYRLLPSTLHGEYVKVTDHPLNLKEISLQPSQSVWAPLSIVEEHDFLTGFQFLSGAGEPSLKSGVAIYSYTAGKSMPENQAFNNADGDWCIIPQKGVLDIRTEFGCLRVRPAELCVIPRGIRFHVALPDGPVRGFVFETYSGHYDLPELGPVGSYCLANVKDFEIPTAAYVDTDRDSDLLTKYGGTVYRTDYRGSIFNVAAWHGTYYPFKYDMAKFSPIGSLLVDHPDPSLYTILTCPSEMPNQPAADICVIGPRWIVMEKSFRPARFHRNTMTEFFFLLKGSLDANPMPAELSGMFGIMNTMTPHGPGLATYERAIAQELGPERVGEENMAVLFETCYMAGVSKWVQETPKKFSTPPDERLAFEQGKIPKQDPVV